MRRLSQLILFTGLFGVLQAQSPHGEKLIIDCKACHDPSGWTVMPEQISFDHGSTEFPLEGVHGSVSCVDCHSSLVFDEADASCVSCHTDIHEMTLGSDCNRCHTVNNWLIDDIQELHFDNGFPLMGAHFSVSCVDCHTSASDLTFPRLGNACTNCHFEDYQNAKEPDHVASGYSLSCTDCHSFDGYTWQAEGINHDFFPLQQGHSGLNCLDCHQVGTYQGLSQDCFSCHAADYAAAKQPNHQLSGFPTDCTLCHTLEPDWMPASFRDHDGEYFPIYSGNHRGEWNSCTECHTTPGNFSLFSCIDCHEHNDANELARDHRGVSGYVYESNACYACHPRGEEE